MASKLETARGAPGQEPGCEGAQASPGEPGTWEESHSAQEEEEEEARENIPLGLQGRVQSEMEQSQVFESRRPPQGDSERGRRMLPVTSGPTVCLAPGRTPVCILWDRLQK